MSDSTPQVKVIRAEDVVWEEIPPRPEENFPPGRQFAAASSPDGHFAVGYWEQDNLQRRMERPYHEIAYILSGHVEIELDDGTVLVAGPGDILDTPKGCTGYWRNLEPVRKVWAIYND
ncbi:MAG: DUF861 domain-containing protein [Actinobacteria bacterium]|jgi:uncharacterized cupin superfamily protein|nr:DUF861 domain-containing protein [Actinomycetota bacterium]